MYYYRFKTRTVFLVGFGIGIVLTLLLLAIQAAFNCSSKCEGSYSNPYAARKDDLFKWLTTDTSNNKENSFQFWKQLSNSSEVTYKEWLESRGLKLRDINVDAYLYEPGSKEETEAEWLSSKIRITCVVFVKKVKLAWAIRNTWGERCNKLYFFGQEKSPDLPIINLNIKLVSSWQLLCESFNYIWREKELHEWLVFVKDDTLVIPENLRYMLRPLNHTRDYYLGHAVVLWGQPYNIADAGYVISIGVLGKLIRMFGSSQKCLTGGKYWKQEDYYLAKHLSSMGIHPSDTRDRYLRGTFHGYPLQTLLWGVVKSSSYWTRAVYPVKNECCSSMSVTLNIGDPDKMYTLNYMLYHLNVLNRAAEHGSRLAATSVPEQDVWRIALREEFNVTNIKNISSEAYYEIWHSKYSEPGQLIGKNNQKRRTDK